MRRFLFIFLMLVIVAGFAGCSSCGKEKAPAVTGFATGPVTADELVNKYVESIVKKDPELLKETLLTEDDFATMQKGRGRQYWQAYFMITKKSFMEKNKDLLGQQLEIVNFQLGREIAKRDGAVIYRGTIINLKTPDGAEHKSEINFVIEAGGRWKIFGLKYLANELQRRGVLKGGGGGVFDGDGKFEQLNGTQDVNIKIKKVDKNKPAEEPQKDAGE